MNDVHLKDERDTLNLGGAIARAVRDVGGMIIYLQGDLGAGKTTMTRGFIQQLGYQGRVKSPTYTLIESYSFERISVHHLDLYRLSDAEELEFMGLRDLLSGNDLFLIEWPEKGEGWLPDAEFDITLSYSGDSRSAKLHYRGKNALLNDRISTITI